MTQTARDFLRVGEVKHLVGGVGIRKRATRAKCDDLRVGVDPFKLLKEGNGATFAIRGGWFVKEGSAGLLDSLREPWLRLFLAPAVSTVNNLSCHLRVVGNILGKNLD